MKKPKNLIQILNEANEVYGDGVMEVYFNMETGEFLDPEDGGDTLAEFVGHEITSIYEPNWSLKSNRSNAAATLERAINELRIVVGHLRSLNHPEVKA